MATIYAFSRDMSALAMRHGTCNLCGLSWPCRSGNDRVACKERIEIRGKETVRLGPNPIPDPDFLMPELDALWAYLADCWGGHDGQDIQDAIEMVKAATAVRQNPVAQADDVQGTSL